jgi:hypothetical protein
MDKIKNSQSFMNTMFQQYIEQVKIEPLKYMKEKNSLVRLLNLPLKEESDQAAPFMIRDKWMTFSQNFLSGLDFDFLILDILTITSIDIWARNDSNIGSTAVLGVLIAYLLDHGLISLREWMGKRNVARKTITDENFLI